MKKLITGMALAVLAAPSAQAWDGGPEDMHTMEDNLSMPLVHIKGTNIPAACGRCAPAGPVHQVARPAPRPVAWKPKVQPVHFVRSGSSCGMQQHRAIRPASRPCTQQYTSYSEFAGVTCPISR